LEGSVRLPPAILTEVPMRRIALAVFLAFSFPLVSLDAEGQQSGKMPRIGVLGMPEPLRTGRLVAVR
jgi:hypothetical protein